MNVPEEKIKKDVIDQLQWDNRVDASGIKVKVDSGSVTLSGAIPSRAAKRAAEMDAWIVAGVKGVNNELEVRIPGGEERPADNDIRINIENSFAVSYNLDASAIDVLVSEGAVALKGTVDSYWKKVHAEDIAWDVNGIVNVENLLSVVPTRNVVDEVIAQDIVNAIDRNALLDAEWINVKVENGLVTLSGAVPDWTSARSAYEAALYTSAVKGIQNDLIINVE